ncbi:uncharacterized protein LOC131930133 [Physella acuta]|uniref:uncharacterized protein LOC131930133 n=1 Tax=Physella acuta TaxID=109671 RepID=UPI0027DCD9CE|nr:uncharacterized protein LOC131930133 [Physella acuta]
MAWRLNVILMGFWLFLTTKTGVLCNSMTLPDLQSTVCPPKTYVCVFDGSCCSAETQFCDRQIQTCNDVFPAGADTLQLCCAEVLNTSSTEGRLNACHFIYGMSLVDQCRGKKENSCVSSDISPILIAVCVVAAVFFCLIIALVVGCLSFRRKANRRRNNLVEEGKHPIMAKVPYEGVDNEEDVTAQIIKDANSLGGSTRSGESNSSDDVSLASSSGTESQVEDSSQQFPRIINASNNNESSALVITGKPYTNPLT